MKRHHWESLVLGLAVLFLAASLWFGVVRPWAQRITAPNQRLHSLVRYERSSGEHYILFALPEGNGHHGAIILWYGCAGCKYMRTLARYEPR